MGASPELLLKIQDGKLSTMALAGTKKIDNSQWGNKELNEQKIVQEEIRKNLMPFCKDLIFGKTKSSRAGNIDHIKTIISGSSSSSPREIIKKLHPTPATAGVPRKKALLNIYSKEKHNRIFYSGYLGLINNENCNLYVNLRSMNIKNNVAKIFVGGGITKDSEPEKEWEEILQKSITMLNVLFD
jgi:isochorismate synthase